MLVYRELQLPLRDITVILDDPDTEELSHLRRQRELATQRISRLPEIVAAVNQMMEEEITDMNAKERAGQRAGGAPPRLDRCLL